MKQEIMLFIWFSHAMNKFATENLSRLKIMEVCGLKISDRFMGKSIIGKKSHILQWDFRGV